MNINNFVPIQKELIKKWSGKNLYIYPGILRMENQNGTELSHAAISQWEAQKLFYELRKNDIIEGGIYPELKCNEGCVATMNNVYIIGPKGEIYKCWNDVSDNSKIVGYIQDANLTNSSLFFRYLLGSKFYYNQECRECFLLPVCSGYCPWFRLKNQYENGKFILCQCVQKVPNMLEKCLEDWYYKPNINLQIQ
ncbi:MAG: SPASM domain-containing protein [Prevotellaceae bacterium]|jgi:uncharacterized protein|nr:SPASM domain-containing protein [Prevotellaceae bacterium]